MSDNKHIGPSFESFLKAEGIYDEVTEVAKQRVAALEELSLVKQQLVEDIEAAMKEQDVSRSDLAKKMETSLSAINRLLDEDNTGVLLSTMVKACWALGKRMDICLYNTKPEESTHSLYDFQ